MSRIDVDDVMSFVKHVEQQKGKYVKQILRRLEKDGLIDPRTRKHVLDGMSSFARAVYSRWYEIEE